MQKSKHVIIDDILWFICRKPYCDGAHVSIVLLIVINIVIFFIFIGVWRWVVVLCFVVHDEFIIYEIKGIRLRFPGIKNHFFLDALGNLRNFVDGLPIVCCVGNAKRELELIRLNKMIAKVVSLNHEEVLYRIFTNRESKTCSDCLDVKEMATKVVTNSSDFWLLLRCKVLLF